MITSEEAKDMNTLLKALIEPNPKVNIRSIEINCWIEKTFPEGKNEYYVSNLIKKMTENQPKVLIIKKIGGGKKVAMPTADTKSFLEIGGFTKNASGDLKMKDDLKGDTYNIFGNVNNRGQFGGKGNVQTNLKINLKDNQDYQKLKELILDLEEYEAEDLKWKELLSQVIYELHQLVLENNKVERNISESRIDRYLSKFKKLKDWVEIAALPASIADKGREMIELWDNVKNFLQHL